MHACNKNNFLTFHKDFLVRISFLFYRTDFKTNKERLRKLPYKAEIVI
jgi:hypothetical protein